MPDPELAGRLSRLGGGGVAETVRLLRAALRSIGLVDSQVHPFEYRTTFAHGRVSTAKVTVELS